MALTLPSGNIKTKRPNSTQAFGFPWADVGRWEPSFSAAAEIYGVNPRLIAAMAVVETGANHYWPSGPHKGRVISVDDGRGDGPSVGIMQVKPKLWDHLIVSDDPYMATDNIHLGAYLMSLFINETGSWQNAIRQKYHPGTSSSGTTPQHYVDTVQALMNEMGGTVADPVIYDLRRDADARRFGLTRNEAEAILAKRTANRNGAQPQGIGLHVQEGFTSGSLRHWLGVAASSTVMVQQDGSILRVINPWDAPWTNGDVQQPDTAIRALRQRFGNDPNMWSLTVEAEDGGTRVINATQAATIRWQIRQWQRDYPQLKGTDWETRIFGHYQVNSVQKDRCGRYRDEMVAGLRSDTTPAPSPVFAGLPDWLPEDAFRVAFPLADPAGVVTKKVIEVVNDTGQVPFFIAKVDVSTGKNLWKFEDFCLLNDGSTVWKEGEQAA